MMLRLVALYALFTLTTVGCGRDARTPSGESRLAEYSLHAAPTEAAPLGRSLALSGDLVPDEAGVFTLVREYAVRVGETRALSFHKHSGAAVCAGVGALDAPVYYMRAEGGDFESVEAPFTPEMTQYSLGHLMPGRYIFGVRITGQSPCSVSLGFQLM